jgi:hypothetical protein
MINTSYPGRRVSPGGDLPFIRLIYGFFEAFRIGEQEVPLPPNNASEASSFILLAPVLLLTMPLTGFLRRRNAALTVLGIYTVVLGLWISVPLPRALEAAMQGLGWQWSPPIRSVLGIGMASIIATTMLFSRVRDGTVDLRSKASRRMAAPLVLVYLLLLGWKLHDMDPVFFSSKLIMVASVIVATMTAGIVLGRARLFAAGLAVAIAPALMVNPLVSGLSAIESKPILLAAKRQGDAVGDRWVVVGDFVLSQGLKAQGLSVLTGSTLIPNREVEGVLDPHGQYEGIWNRYAHVTMRSDPGRAVPVYEVRTPDVYVVGVDICGTALRKLGINRVAYTDAVPAPDLNCLIPLDAPTDSGVHLFRLTSPKTPSP